MFGDRNNALFGSMISSNFSNLCSNANMPSLNNMQSDRNNSLLLLTGAPAPALSTINVKHSAEFFEQIFQQQLIKQQQQQNFKTNLNSNISTKLPQNLTQPSTQLLISPPPSYSESLKNQQRINDSMQFLTTIKKLNTQTQQISSPDIVRLAADTTAVSLHDSDDKLQKQQSFYPKQFCTQQPITSCSQSVNVSNSPLINTIENNDDKPLDLSVKHSKHYISQCTSTPSSSTSTSTCASPSLKPIRHSFTKNSDTSNRNNKNCEVKRSASSVTHRTTTSFDADVAEHFRRSLSGKWPRRQPNYAHYISPSSNTPKTMIENNLGLKITSQPILSSSSTQFTNFGQLTSHLSTELNNAPLNHQIFNKDLQNTIKTQKSSSLLEMWQKTSTPTLPDIKSTSSTSSSAFLTPSQSVSSSVQIFHSTFNTSNNINFKPLPIKKSNVSTNVVRKIIINEGRPVEDHFRMALGDKTFQLLRKAQKNNTNKLEEKKIIFDYQQQAVTATTMTQNHVNNNENLQFNQKDNIDDDDVIVDDDDNEQFNYFQKQQMFT